MAEIQQYTKDQAAAQLQGSLKSQVEEVKILHYQFAGAAGRRIIAKLESGKIYDFALKKEFDSAEKLLKFLGADKGSSREEKVGNDFFKPAEKQKTRAQPKQEPDLTKDIAAVSKTQPNPATGKNTPTSSEKKTEKPVQNTDGVERSDKGAEHGFFGDSLMFGTYLALESKKTDSKIAASAKVGSPISYATGKINEFNQSNSHTLGMCVLQTGINDVTGGAKKEDIKKDYETLITAATNACKKGGTVYIVGLLPYTSKQDIVNELNSYLKTKDKTAKNGVNIVFIDPGDYLPGEWKTTMIHQKLQDKYYASLANELRNLMGADASIAMKKQ